MVANSLRFSGNSEQFWKNVSSLHVNGYQLNDIKNIISRETLSKGLILGQWTSKMVIVFVYGYCYDNVHTASCSWITVKLGNTYVWLWEKNICENICWNTRFSCCYAIYISDKKTMNSWKYMSYNKRLMFLTNYLIVIILLNMYSTPLLCGPVPRATWLRSPLFLIFVSYILLINSGIFS